MAAKKTAKSKTTAKRKTRVSAKSKTTTKRKVVAKAKTTAKRKTVAKKPAAKKRLTAIRTPFSKTQTVAEIAESTELSKKEVVAVLDAMGDLIHRHIKPGGAGQFTLPGLAKITTKHKKATKARKGINPFTGEETTFKAKPASNVVKVRPLKKLKEMASK